MKIGLIGCGRVGISIFHLLKKNNKIAGIYDINNHNLTRGMKLLGLNKILTLEEICSRSNAIFIATPDDQIKSVYRTFKRYLRGKKYIFHFSGALHSGIIPESKNIYRASVHPFATFPDIVLRPKKYYLFIEGDPLALRVARKIFSGNYFILRNLKYKNKKGYHLIGVFSSNLLIGYLSLIKELAQEIGWEEYEFHNFIIPIIEDTIKNVKKYGLKNGLSGPLKRGDKTVIKKHLKILKRNRDLNQLYRILSNSILENLIDYKGKKDLLKLFRTQK